MTNEPERERATLVPFSMLQQILEVLGKMIPLLPLLWFAFAVAAFVWLFPLAEDAIKRGLVDSIKLGVLEVHLRAVPSTTFPKNVGGDLIIPPKERAALIARFSRLADFTQGAKILWVDDGHPYQNANERRVLLDANMSVDLARTTNEAMEWLERSKYDVVITDLNRSSVKDYSARCFIAPDKVDSQCAVSEDPPAPCYNTSDHSEAGCALLRKIGSCFQETTASGSECSWLRFVQGNSAPTMLVYAAHFDPSLTPVYAAHITNRAVKLFNYVLDAAEQRDIRSEVEDGCGSCQRWSKPDK